MITLQRPNSVKKMDNSLRSTMESIFRYELAFLEGIEKESNRNRNDKMIQNKVQLKMSSFKDIFNMCCKHINKNKFIYFRYCELNGWVLLNIIFKCKKYDSDMPI